jgi:hypothetical protein
MFFHVLKNLDKIYNYRWFMLATFGETPIFTAKLHILADKPCLGVLNLSFILKFQKQKYYPFQFFKYHDQYFLKNIPN